jgi:galactofuranose transport system permease protein
MSQPSASIQAAPQRPAGGPSRRDRLLGWRYLPLAVTVTLFLLMYGTGSVAFDGFFSAQVFLNLFVDNAFLIVTAVGMTFVIISGGIDLSVGAVIAFTTMASASLIQGRGWNPWATMALVLFLGALLGLAHGVTVHFFRLQPFIVTLAGQFLARGLCYVISTDSITIKDPVFRAISEARIPLVFHGAITVSVVIALVVFAVAVFLAHYTRFGRTMYAIGGSESSAVLMGLPVARTKILVYTMSGFCSALAGLVFSFYMLSGYGLHASGLEMDAIAAAVVGGTLLTGGAGYVAGTLVGVLIMGTIQTLIMFQGDLSSWWTKIVIGLLLLVFCLLQRAFQRSAVRRLASAAPRAAPAPAAAGLRSA